MKHWLAGSIVVNALALAFLTPSASAQIVSIPPSKLPQYDNTIGLGVSYGPFIGRDATFWGLAIDYRASA